VKKEVEVEPRLEHLRRPTGRRRQSVAPPDERRSLRSLPSPHPTNEASVAKPSTPPSPPNDTTSPVRDPGLTLLGTVTAAVLSIVALSWLVAVVARWWVLVPAIAIALALTAIVLGVMVRLLNDSE
jgi:hypothetical protein